MLDGTKNILASLEGLGYEKVRQGLVSMVLEKTLLDIDSSTYCKVKDELKQRYRCQLTDCYAHPEYLISILKDMYGDSYKHIIKSINKQLEEFSYQKPIEKFIESLDQ